MINETESNFYDWFYVIFIVPNLPCHLKNRSYEKYHGDLEKRGGVVGGHDVVAHERQESPCNDRVTVSCERHNPQFSPLFKKVV